METTEVLPELKNSFVINISGYDQFEEKLFIIVEYKESSSEALGESQIEKSRFIVVVRAIEVDEVSTDTDSVLHYLNISQVEGIEDGFYVAIHLGTVTENIFHIKAGQSIAIQSSSVEETTNISYEMDKIVTRQITGIEGFKDGNFLFLPMSNVQNSMQNENVMWMNENFSIINIFHVEGIEAGYYACIPLNINNNSEQINHPSIIVQSVAEVLQLENLDLLHPTNNAIFIANIFNIESVNNGSYILIRLTERIQEPGIAYENVNDDINNFADLITFPQDNLNFPLFMEILQNADMPTGATFFQIKNHLAANGFHVTSKRLTDLLFRGVTKHRIEKLPGKKFKAILPPMLE